MSDLPPLDQDWQSKVELQAGLSHLFHHQVGCDVIFNVGRNGNEDRIGTHSAVLMARSPVLFKECAAGLPDFEFNLPEYTKEEVECFLTYLYTSEIDLGNNNVEAVQKLSEFFEVHNLTRYLLKLQLDTLPVERFCNFVHAHEAKLTGMLQFKCLDYIFQQPGEVFRSAGFKYLPEPFLKSLITHPYLVLDEEQICTAMLLWASYHCELRRLQVNGENQRQVLGDMLFDIRFPILDKDFFTDNISEKQLLLDIEEVQLLKFYLNPKRALDAKFPFLTEERKAPEKPFAPDNIDTPAPIVRQSSVPLHPVPSQPIIHPLQAGEHGLIRRFLEEGQGWGYRGNKKDAIAFVTDKKIRLDYVLIYGTKANCSMDVMMIISDDESELSTTRITLQGLGKETSPHLHEVGVENESGCYGIELEDDKEYHVILQIASQCGYYGKRGEATVTDNGVTFNFRKSKYSSNNTTPVVGQIMGFKFTRL